ncbi:MAG: heavy-metal-associated domain-containing protein [Bacteroidota bacterium]
MKIAELKIEGMSCGHCVMSVRKELGKLAGVVVNDVQIGSATLGIDETRITPGDLSKAVEEAGYTVSSIT